MFSVLLAVIFAVATIASGQSAAWDQSLGDATTFQDAPSERQGKFFPLFSVIRFANTQCTGSNNLNGTCFTRRECSNYGGTASGTCANSLGVCCVFVRTCGSTTNMNNTYFINPDYPTTYAGGDRCTIVVRPCNSHICQLRLDFLDFSLAQPDGTGVCDLDFLTVTGGATLVPRLCGENTNQHVYVDFDGPAPITISIDTDVNYVFDRRWNIRIQQIACESVWRAPSGCLQYYTTTTGTVTSFNYGTVVNPRSPLVGTRQLVNLNYGVCVRMTVGYCAIQWSQDNTLSFTVSGDTDGLDTTVIGTDLAAVTGTDCTADFVIIPNPFDTTGTALDVDRFCGNGFVTVISSSKPFVLYVITNGDETGDVLNRGFILDYQQIACPIF
ncbi:cubilin isoform X1 [Diprion similis]|uniref:cubilin isoform X1 n=1 Tax=Diprion similis TaxID=362088 RepID=UPI001EF8BA7C|nr:cubilin isoform X1 [Diprion similis]